MPPKRAASKAVCLSVVRWFEVFPAAHSPHVLEPDRCRLVEELAAFAAVLAPVIGLQRFRRDLVVREHL